MSRFRGSFVVLLLLLASTLRADTHVELYALPDFLQRVFVPTVPGAENTFRVHGLTVDAITSSARGFVCSRRDGMLVIKAPKGEASGYVVGHEVDDRQRQLAMSQADVAEESMAIGNASAMGYGSFAVCAAQDDRGR